MSVSAPDRISYAAIRRFGVIAPSVNTVLEPEYYSVKPDDVTFHMTRARIRVGSDPDELRAMAEEAPEVAVNLADARPERIMFACTSGSLFGGPGYDRKIAQAIESKVGIPTTTTATAVVDAFRALGVDRAAMATPYLDWVTEAEAAFFEANGVRILRWVDLKEQDGHVMAALTPADVMDLARQADHPDAQAVFLSCTDLPTFSVLGLLERELGKPVFSSNSASLWALLGSDRRLRKLGRLFDGA